MELKIPRKALLINFACRVSENSLLISLPLSKIPSARAEILVNNNVIERPYTGTTLSRNGEEKTAIFLLSLGSEVKIDAIESIEIHDQDELFLFKAQEIKSLAASRSEIKYFIDELSDVDKKRILYLLLKFSTFHQRNAFNADFGDFFQAFHMQCRDITSWKIMDSLFLVSNILLVKMRVPKTSMPAEGEIAIRTHRGMISSQCKFLVSPDLDDSQSCYVHVIGHFPQSLQHIASQSDIYITAAKKLITCVGDVNIERDDVNQRLVSAIKSMPHDYSSNLREIIATILRKYHIESERPRAKNLIENIQMFIETPHISVIDDYHPFGISLDCAVSWRDQYLFVSGWCRDPLNQLTELDAISDLGITIPIHSFMRRYHRPSVEEQCYKNAIHQNIKGKWGFVAWVPIDEDIRENIAHIARFRNWRIRAEIRSSMDYYLSPPPLSYDSTHILRMLRKEVFPKLNDDKEAVAVFIEAYKRFQENQNQRMYLENDVMYQQDNKEPQHFLLSICMRSPRDRLQMHAQLAASSQFSTISKIEYIYVIDNSNHDPNSMAEEEIEKEAEELSYIYRNARIRVVSFDYGGGFALSMNKVSNLARGQYIGFAPEYWAPAQKTFGKEIAEILSDISKNDSEEIAYITEILDEYGDSITDIDEIKTPMLLTKRKAFAGFKEYYQMPDYAIKAFKSSCNVKKIDVSIMKYYHEKEFGKLQNEIDQWSFLNL